MNVYHEWKEWAIKGFINWELLEFPLHQELQRLFKEFNFFYKKSKALWEKDYTNLGYDWIDDSEVQNGILAYLRTGGDEHLVCVHNFMPDNHKDYFVEIQNVSSVNVDTTGWFIAASDDYSYINDANSTVWNLGQTFSSGEIAYKTDVSGDNYWGSNLFWNNGSPGWVVLCDAQGIVLDAIFWGWSEAQIATFAPQVNGLSLQLNCTFLGSFQTFRYRQIVASLSYDA